VNKKVIIDTCIWSQAFRRKKPNEFVITELGTLIENNSVCILGPIRQELLSGIKDPQKFEFLRKKLRALEDETITTNDYELAAKFSNQCRTHGIQGSAVDYLICAIASNKNYPIFTDDKDFYEYQKVLPIKIYGIKENPSES